MAQGALGPSTVLDGRYELLEPLGRGGMATVWRARDQRLSRTVAVKVIADHLASDGELERRFENEARRVATLSHPGIVTVHDYGIDDGRPYIVMELVHGRSLQRLLAEGPLPWRRVQLLARQVLAALDHAHKKGIIHRDVKPGNILIAEDGTAKVADFGISTATGETTEIRAGQPAGNVIGTAAYASPEQLEGANVDPRSDLYSLGCVLYQALAGRPPFIDEDLSRLVLQQRFAEPPPLTNVAPSVPQDVADAVQRALAKDPDGRCASAAEMLVSFSDTDPGTGGATLTGTPTQVTLTGLEVSAPDDVTKFSVSVPHDDTPVTFLRTGPLATGEIPAASPRHRRLALRLFVTFLVVAVIALGTILALANSSSDQTTRLVPGSVLRSGTSLMSSSGRFGLTMEPTGNLAVHENGDPAPTWQSGSAGHDRAYATLQSDGNFVVYPRGFSAPTPFQLTQALWDSGTSGHPGAAVTLADNGSLRIVNQHGKVLWQSGPAPPSGPVGSELLPGATLNPSQALRSPDGRYELFNNPVTGSLELGPVGGSHCALGGTAVAPSEKNASVDLAMQQDGNLVATRAATTTVLYESGTVSNPASSLVLEDGGTLVILSETGFELWKATPSPGSKSPKACSAAVSFL